MWCEDGEGGTDRYVCKIVEIESPNRIVWSWVLDGRQAHGETRVDFCLEEVSGGTRLSVRHSGDRDSDTIERFRAGWPVKLDQLDNALRTGSLG